MELLPSLREAVRAEPNSCSSEVALFWAVPPRFPVQSKGQLGHQLANWSSGVFARNGQRRFIARELSGALS